MSAEWLQWYYLIYLLPAAVAVVVFLMTGVGGHHGGHSHAAHGGLHLHAHHGTAHGSASSHHGALPGGHGPASSSHAPAAGHHGSAPAHGPDRAPGVGQQLLGYFGFGRAPLTIVIGSMMLGWGVVGLAATDMLRRELHWPPMLFIGPALAAAAAGSLTAARLFGELAARLLPKDESYAIGREGLLGLTGKVVYPVTETGGRVHLFDQHRTLHVEPARVGSGQTPIEKGTEVIVASMDPERGTLIVEPLGFRRSVISERTSANNHRRSAAGESRELEVRDGES